ncbi:hypothetical protein MTO96_019668 [Rhipicephalus appendiculatus]
MTETVVANTVAEGADTVAVDWGSVVCSVGNCGHWSVVDCGSGNSWSGVDGSDSWGSGVCGDWGSSNDWGMGDGGDSWGVVGRGNLRHSWSSGNNGSRSIAGDSWSSDSGSNWSVGNGGDSGSSVVGSHSWGSHTKAVGVAGAADEASESAGGKSQDNADTDLKE